LVRKQKTGKMNAAQSPFLARFVPFCRFIYRGDRGERGIQTPIESAAVESLRPESLTWTGLLAQWVRFAQASAALPKGDAEGDRWRASVPAVINLQAVTFALGDLDRLAASERPLALDKAELIIRDSRRQLQELWGDAMTPTLHELCNDADDALRARQMQLQLQESPSPEKNNDDA